MHPYHIQYQKETNGGTVLVFSGNTNHDFYWWCNKFLQSSGTDSWPFTTFTIWDGCCWSLCWLFIATMLTAQVKKFGRNVTPPKLRQWNNHWKSVAAIWSSTEPQMQDFHFPFFSTAVNFLAGGGMTITNLFLLLKRNMYNKSSDMAKSAYTCRLDYWNEIYLLLHAIKQSECLKTEWGGGGRSPVVKYQTIQTCQKIKQTSNSYTLLIVPSIINAATNSLLLFLRKIRWYIQH